MADLPILQFEDTIMKAVEENPVVVVIGETGSGKSTQLSQILHRRGYTRSGVVGVTQPRRVAAVSVARRVSQELGVRLGDEVGYAIRFEDRTSERTRIKYLTDGVLLRESLSNPELDQYSVIILDEAHERSLNTDILLGLMKRLVKRRASNFKVLITSATLDGEKVSQFFSNCPVVKVPGKLFPVEIAYSRERPASYLESSLETALNIHIKQGEGDVLIFMTGQDEIDKLVLKLEERVRSLEEGSCMDAIILPLHGSLQPEMQVRVFGPRPPNCRRFIVATNIAETSLTVDGVVYVIDSGYVKQRQYNPSTGMYSLDVVQISKVQANQRAGRAGRTRPGKCYRLYPSTVYEDEFLDATIPEIQRSSLAGSVLYLKSLDLPDIDILKFDFLDSPSPESLQDALKQLYLIDAIDENGLITRVGKTMAELPLEPSLSRTLMEANEYGCLSQALTVAAMLSAETTLLPGRSKSTDKKRKHDYLDLPDGSGWGDHIQLLQIYECWHQTDYDIDWCKDYQLQVRGMKFVKDVRKQLSQIMQKIAKGSLDVQTSRRRNESQQDYHNLRKALCVGYANQLAERMMHHNGYRTLGFKPQVVQVHPSSVLKPDDEGKLPDYVVYHELIATTRPFLRTVCAVNVAWVRPILDKVNNLNIKKLSGGIGRIEEQPEGNLSDLPKKEDVVAPVLDDRESRVQAARERFLARKGKK
ncbi:probable pre-mRNA-splicing factor ATP-dependent RNA helicase DEAH4 isoform X1 [Pyrus x bretschneideri]|uniref:probable pre-mRNA-splicing factor ATP-dependent RNA helicase DEAH4 isoform X1 n=1 Tax=Pyrus x bretschneideri TaxID=225117 RepID=UPI00203042AE|nr:probable pre-mRNA-splicing factor ATP-dependent RNA helicase DEAH4 isoform X1 [Pyrus x bretschneideri]XP_048428081.1 probable pre-mRNA-splicing factor ATP-dependent RNA helicase DEAH4 isoform X1 [Pyrus x bretschneideri]